MRKLLGGLVVKDIQFAQIIFLPGLIASTVVDDDGILPNPVQIQPCVRFRPQDKKTLGHVVKIGIQW